MWGHRPGVSTVALTLGLMLTVFITVLASLLIGQIHREAAMERSREIAERLSLQLVNVEHQLIAMTAHLTTLDRLDPERFGQFYRALGTGRQLGTHEAFAFMAATPSWSLDTLAAFLNRNAERFDAAGYPPVPELASGPNDATHFPVLMVEPPVARDRLFGFDLVNARMRFDTARRALDSRAIALSDPVLFGQPATGRPFTMLMAAPVSLSPAVAADLGISTDAGLVAASIDPEPLLNAIIERPGAGILALSLSMVGAEGSASVARERALPSERMTLLRSAHTVVVPDIPLADRQLSLTVTGTVGYNRFEVFGLVVVIAIGLLSTLLAVSVTRKVDSERHLVENELKRKRVALERAATTAQETQRLESLGRLVGGVAHDFNNLMTVILGNLEFLREEKLQAARDGLVDEAIRATERGRALTAQLLAFGRRAQLDPRPVDLSAVMHDASRAIGRILPDQIALRVDPPSGLWPVKVDRNQLDNAILNLVLNARDAMPDGGTITLSAANLQFGGANGFGASEDLPAGRYVMLAVSDTGHGMDRATIAQAFEPFFTTKTVGEGSGLGLSMVFGFAKQSGGSARISSTVNVGTSVKLFFPVSGDVAGTAMDMPALPAPDDTPAALAPDTESLERAPNAVPPRSILVVEDDAAVRRLVAARLRGAGYAVAVAENGDAALELLRDEPARDVDLLLSDIVMPGRLQGPDLAREVTRIRPTTKTAFLSGYPRELTLDSIDVLAGHTVLTKPINGEDLLSAVNELIGPPDR
ncbi:MAG: ATP-binding protein [Pseudomonadota bacterium]